MQLIYGAVALLLIVVAVVIGLLSFDSRRATTGHWLDNLRQWQALLGSLLGFVSAAAVLVLGQSLQAYQGEVKTEQSQHAIGYGLAIEAEELAAGMRTGAAIGGELRFAGLDLTLECQHYVDAVARAVPPGAPVYTAVLGNITEFGDANLAIFVRFYALQASLMRLLPASRAGDCATTPAETMRLIAEMLRNGLRYYDVIAANYHTIDAPIPPLPAVPAPTPGGAAAGP